MEPGLYLVATPIGNLKDMTFRAVDVLSEADEILAEDTRHTGRLLQHYEIKTPMKSYHRFNEAARQDDIITRIQAGAVIALVSDAGTPAVSDPGSRLVRACRDQECRVVSIPGPSAVTCAVSLAGFDEGAWTFHGFLPAKPGKRRKALTALVESSSHSILFVSPYKLLRVLEALHELCPQRRCAVGRELTKRFEEFREGVPADLKFHYETGRIRGECVLILYKSEGDDV